MSNDPIFDIPYLANNSASPEVVVNAQMDALIARIAKRLLVGLGATNTVTLTQAGQRAGGYHLLDATSPGPNAAVTVNYNAAALGLFVIENQCGYTATIKVTGQVGPLPTLAHGAIGIFLHDGITIRKLL